MLGITLAKKSRESDFVGKNFDLDNKKFRFISILARVSFELAVIPWSRLELKSSFFQASLWCRNHMSGTIKSQSFYVTWIILYRNNLQKITINFDLGKKFRLLSENCFRRFYGSLPWVNIISRDLELIIQSTFLFVRFKTFTVHNSVHNSTIIYTFTVFHFMKSSWNTFFALRTNIFNNNNKIIPFLIPV